MNHYYTNERNHQILIALLKSHGIRKVVASPGIANSVFVGSIQHDPFFTIYSAVDERSAAYMACGLAYESNEPVVISCTGATAARNYMPGMTEAFYSKLPILCITSSQPSNRIGHLCPQVTDRTSPPNDVARLSVTMPTVNTPADEWECEIQGNRALLELKRHGGGPAHINLITAYGYNDITALTCKTLPKVRRIDRIGIFDTFPEIPTGRVGIYVGLHKTWSDELTQAVDAFCAEHNAVVFCDHTSNYHGEYGVPFALAINQSPTIMRGEAAFSVELLIHIGEVSGEENAISMIKGNATWRVSPDGEIRDWFRNVSCVFEMPEVAFFKHYATEKTGQGNTFYGECYSLVQKLQSEARSMLNVMPLSNVWLALQVAPRIPEGSYVVLSILNTLRTWNYAQFQKAVTVFCPTGGFGIDGIPSLLLGASLNNPNRLHYGIIGDLAFFYDMNALGNRHVGANIRILLVNNGCGVEFKKSYAMSYKLLGEDVGSYVSADGHFGARCPGVTKAYAEALGFTYLVAHSKDELQSRLVAFTNPDYTEAPILLEVFINDSDERLALDIIHQRKIIQ